MERLRWPCWITVHALLGLWSQAEYAAAAGGQSVVEATCPLDAHWAYNSLNQSVCTVASNLAAVCNDRRIYTIPALTQPGSVYGGPDKGDDCRCNSVFYSLLSACAVCQGYRYISWSAFDENCTNPLVGAYPDDIPEDTAVFGWAYANVSITNTFDSTSAESEPDAAESTFTPSATSTLLIGTTTPSVTPQRKGKSSTNVGAIAGGAVGGLAFLAILTLFAIWLLKRRKGADYTATTANSAPMTQSSLTSTTFYDHTPTQSPVVYYSVNPSTFPRSPVSPSTIYTTYPDGGSVAVSGMPVHHRTVSDGRYSGAPEI